MSDNSFKNNTPEKKKTPKAGLLGSGAVAAMGFSIATNPDLAPTYTPDTTQDAGTRYEEQASGADLEATQLPDGFTTEPLPAQAPGVEDVRPEHRQSFKKLEHPLLLLDYLLDSQAARLGVDPDVFRNRMDSLFNMFASIESSMNPHAANPDSSSLGLYQYQINNNDPGKQNGSIHTAVNRLHRMLNKEQFIDEPQPNNNPSMAWTHDLYTNPGIIVDIPMENQQLLVLADLVAQSGTDEHLKALTSDNPREVRNAALALYYQAHHTDPDDAVRANAERKVDNYFPINEYLTAEM